MKSHAINLKIIELDSNPKDIVEKLESLHIADVQIDSDLLAQNIFLLGRGYLITGKYEKSIVYLNKALNYYLIKSDKLCIYLCYSNLGVVYRESNEFELALKYMNRSYHISYELDEFSYVVMALVNLGSIYTALENNDKSLEYLEKALEFKSQIENSKMLGDLYNNYSFALMGKQQFEKALKYLLLAYEVYKNFFGGEIHTNMVIVISNIGEVYLKLKNYESANAYLSLALDYATQKNIKAIEMDCHKNISIILEMTGHFEQALIHYKEFTNLKDEMSYTKTEDEIANLNEHLESESKKNEEEINTLRNVDLKNKTNELEKMLKNVAQISEIGQRLTSSMDINQIYEILRNSIYKLMNVDVFGLALYDSKKETLIYKYFEEQGMALPLMEVNINDKMSLSSYCIINNEDMFVKSFYDEYTNYLPSIEYIGIGDKKAGTTECIVYCRLISEEGCIGLITMQNYNPYEYKQSDFEVIRALASYVAIAISNAQKKNTITEKANQLEYLSYNDPLTNLFNRRFFTNAMLECSNESCLPLGLIVLDMNNLKKINDTLGHLVGDEYLIALANILKEKASEHHVFRLGGDEFAILLNNTSTDQLVSLKKEISESCKSANINKIEMSVAMGCYLKTQVEEDMDSIFTIAESKMYQEKQKFHSHER